MRWLIFVVSVQFALRGLLQGVKHFVVCCRITQLAYSHPGKIAVASRVGDFRRVILLLLVF